MIILDIPQQSPEWFKERAGRPSASCFDQIVTSRGEPSKSAQKYMYQLAGERITGIKTETFQSEAMKRGVELEAEARAYFELVYDVEIKQVGICYPDEQKRYACSPDGLTDTFGLEIKCPLIHTHVQYLLDDKLPTDYIQQVQGGMYVTGLDRWFFMSYYPGLPPLIKEVKLDEDFGFKLSAQLDMFCNQLEKVTDKLRSLS